MDDFEIVDLSFTAIVNAPLDRIDIPTWCFNLPEQEYQARSPAHVSAGFATAPDGKRSVNVEVIGGSLMVKHYVEALDEKHHLVLELLSDIFTPGGRVGAERQADRRSPVRVHQPRSVAGHGGTQVTAG